MEPLREEIIGVVEESGWSKKSIDRLDKLDSVIRETQRMSPISAGESIATRHTRYRSEAPFFSPSLDPASCRG